jgi:hypothetical protein
LYTQRAWRSLHGLPEISSRTRRLHFLYINRKPDRGAVTTGHTEPVARVWLDGNHLARLVLNTPSLRINPVIYDRNTQVMFIDAILNRGFAAHQSGAPNAREAAIAALVFATPLMKAPGFAEEREWRLIFMPAGIGTPPQLGFHPRRDFLAPFITLGHIWNDLRLAMLKIPDLDATLGPAPLRPSANVPPLVPITKVRIGPPSIAKRAINSEIDYPGQSPHSGDSKISDTVSKSCMNSRGAGGATTAEPTEAGALGDTR